jgi:hypothetical protein
VVFLKLHAEQGGDTDTQADLTFFFLNSILRLLKGIWGQCPGHFPGLRIDGGFFGGRFLWFLIAGTG